VVLDRFYRAGGEQAKVTPTACRVAYNSESLFVLFRCEEPDLAFPVADHHADWQALLQSPPEQDAAFPDKVDFFYAQDPNKPVLYHFAATLDGQKFGVMRGSSLDPVSTEDPSVISTNHLKVVSFDASVIKRKGEWIAFFRIPWQTLGGKPAASFSFLPTRTRWRDSEKLSPVAIDFPDAAPMDLFIEARLPENSASPRLASSGPVTCLYKMPGGTLRWQRPAFLTYPGPETVKEIRRLGQSLGLPTTSANLAERVFLTQRWSDLMALEGFNFRPTSGSIVEEDLSPYIVRRHVNVALRHEDLAQACRLLDKYLAKLDNVSRKWFADGTPADIAQDEWKHISECQNLEQQGNIVVLKCKAGSRPVELHLAFPKEGGARLYANAEGFFKPSALLPVHATSEGVRQTFATANGDRVSVQLKPLKLSFYDSNGKTVLSVDGANVSFRFDEAGKVLGVDFRSHLDPNEIIFGFGEKFDRFNQHGNVLTLWGMDDWAGTTAGLRNESYQPVPVFHSSAGYAVFDNSSYRFRADIGLTRPEEYRLTQPGPIFDFYIWAAPPERALESYTALTGKPLLPPKWAFEPWMGRTGRGWNNAPGHNPVAEQERVMERFAELDIPHSALYAEGSAADTPALYEFLRPRGIKALSWYYCAIPQAEQAKLMENQAVESLAVLKTGGNEHSKEINYVDFTNPNALEVARRWWRSRLNLGLAGSMVDFGDRVPESALFSNGKTGAEMHNFYSYDYQRTYNEVFREKRGEDFILFGRAAAPGTQRWAGQFAGDHRANFVGLQAVLTGAMNLCACGFSTWGSDLGGFLGWPEPAVYARWTQFACFSPLMRCHGRTPREPWEYGSAALANYKHYAWVRENLLDYIYNAAIAAHETGVPIMRSMAVAFPDETSLAGVSNQYMFGRDLLVAPVVNEENSREVDFPAGRWASMWDGQTVIGPRKVKVASPFDTIPVYLREGALLPLSLNADLQFGHSLSQGSVDALIVTPPKTDEIVTWLNAKKQTVNARVKPIADGIAITLDNAPETGYLLVYGTSISGVKVDKMALRSLDATELASHTGWASDPTINRVIVHLPPPSADDKLRTRKIEVELGLRIANR
jgi:alpha-glucosidase (family GH31 glycosyl hydrolase)